MIIKELAVVADTYTDRNGNEKKKWLNIGHIHEAKDGRQYITLDPCVNLAAIPRKQGDSRVYVSMFEPRARDQATAQPTDAKSQLEHAAAGDDEIPF